MDVIRAVDWSPAGNAVRIIDQRGLPARADYRDLRSVEDVADAIRTLAVRGAPAIGIAAAMGLVASLHLHATLPVAAFIERARRHAELLRGTRPTAVNLDWALDRMLGILDRAGDDVDAILAAMRAEATAIWEEDRAMCRRIGEHGASLVHDGARVLTHCNAGALATAGIGTALAPIYIAAERGRRVHVFADETRPLLQGSRLTAWELTRAGVPVTVLADDAAASLMRDGSVDLVLVGADRIAANGDVANKIGTYPLAIAARHHGVPFFVAAPWSTVDASTESGAAMVIEQRAPAEVAEWAGVRIAADRADVYNPAFDVTPAALITAIISDRGVHHPPFDFGTPAS